MFHSEELFEKPGKVFPHDELSEDEKLRASIDEPYVIQTEAPFQKTYARNGKLIVIEGMDGAGKTTQIENVYNYLKEQGMDVVKFREPGGTEAGEKIREILLGSDLHAYTELLLFTAARMELVMTKIIPALEEGKIILLDRFVHTTRAYQGGGRNIQHEASMMTSEIFGNVFPDHVIYLQIPQDVVVDRRKKRFDAAKLDTFEKQGIDFHDRVLSHFEKEFKDLNSFDTDAVAIIDATQGLEEVFADIKTWLDQKVLP